MTQTFICTSENGNSYIYDTKSKLSILVHPEMKKAIENTSDPDSYYMRKYKYLKKYGFFTETNIVNWGLVTESMIKNNMPEIPQIVFETTDFCNLSCTYCALGDVYEGFDARNQKKIDIDKAIVFLKYIFSIKSKSSKNQLYISFFGGEPLVNGAFIKQIVEIAEQLNSNKNLELIYTITTNATLLHKYIDFLAKNKFQLLISLDGNEKNHSYRSFRNNQKNSFKKVISNVDMLQKAYPEYFKQYVNFNAVLHDRNSVKDIYEFIYPRYHKVPRISELNPCDINPHKIDLFNQMFKDKFENEAEYAKEESNFLPHEERIQYKELTEFIKNNSVNCYISDINELFAKEKTYLPTGTCLPFWKKLMLTTNNKLALCEKVNYHKLTVGEVDETVKIDIHKIVQQYNFYYKNVQKLCLKCYANKSCSVCLFLMRDRNLEKLNEGNFVCEDFCDEKRFGRKLNRVLSFLEKFPKDNFSIIENIVIS